MGGGSWTNLYGTTLWSGHENDRQNVVSRNNAIFKADSVRCVCFLFFFHGLVRFVVFSYPVR